MSRARALARIRSYLGGDPRADDDVHRQIVLASQPTQIFRGGAAKAATAEERPALAEIFH